VCKKSGLLQTFQKQVVHVHSTACMAHMGMWMRAKCCACMALIYQNFNILNASNIPITRPSSLCMQPRAKFQPVGRTAMPNTSVPGNTTETLFCLGYTTCWASRNHTAAFPCKHGNASEQATWVGGRQTTARPEQCGVHVCTKTPKRYKGMHRDCSCTRMPARQAAYCTKERSVQASGLLCLVLVPAKPLGKLPAPEAGPGTRPTPYNVKYKSMARMPCAPVPSRRLHRRPARLIHSSALAQGSALGTRACQHRHAALHGALRQTDSGLFQSCPRRASFHAPDHTQIRLKRTHGPQGSNVPLVQSASPSHVASSRRTASLGAEPHSKRTPCHGWQRPLGRVALSAPSPTRLRPAEP